MTQGLIPRGSGIYHIRLPRQHPKPAGTTVRTAQKRAHSISERVQ